MYENLEDKKFDEHLKRIFDEFDYSSEFPLSSEDLNNFYEKWENITLEKNFSYHLNDDELIENLFKNQTDFKAFRRKYLVKKASSKLLLIPLVAFLLLLVILIIEPIRKNLFYKKTEHSGITSIDLKSNTFKKSNEKIVHPTLSKNTSSNTMHNVPSNFNLNNKINHQIKQKNKLTNFKITSNFNPNKNQISFKEKKEYNLFFGSKKHAKSQNIQNNENHDLNLNSITNKNILSFTNNNLVNEIIVLPIRIYNFSSCEPDIQTSHFSDSLIMLFPTFKNPIRTYISSQVYFGYSNNQLFLSGGLGIGALFQYKINQNISIHYGIGTNIIHHFSQKFLYKKRIEYGFGQTVRSTFLVPINSYYLSFPFMLSYKWKKFIFSSGLSWEYHIKSTVRLEEYSVDHNTNKIINQNTYDLIPDFQYAQNLMFRFRMEYNLNKHFGFDFQYVVVKYPFIKLKYMSSYSPQGIQASLIYKFNIK